MKNVALNESTRPAGPVDPAVRRLLDDAAKGAIPLAGRMKRRPDGLLQPPKPLVDAVAHMVAKSITAEDERERRWKTESEEREAKRARDFAEYAKLTTTKTSSTQLDSMSVSELFAFASGTCEWDLISALLQENTLAIRTIRGALRDAYDDCDTLSTQDLDSVLFTLERRAEVLEELYGRIALPLMHRERRAIGALDEHERRASGALDASADTDTAAEE